MQLKRLDEQTDQEILQQLEDDALARAIHKRLFMLRHSLSEREMHLEDKVMELKKKLDQHNIDY